MWNDVRSRIQCALARGSRAHGCRNENRDDSGAHWIKLVARENGSFRVLNGRTQQWKQYAAKR
jgi:hypothetical protein